MVNREIEGWESQGRKLSGRSGCEAAIAIREAGSDEHFQSSAVLAVWAVSRVLEHGSTLCPMVMAVHVVDGAEVLDLLYSQSRSKSHLHGEPLQYW